MVLLNRPHRYCGAVLLMLALAWASSCTSLDDVTAPSCAFVLSSTSATFDSRGGTGTIAVRAANSCTWTVTANDPWVTLTTATSGRGDGSIGYSIAANPGATSRSATVNVAGQSVTVSQSGAGSSCTYAAAPGSASYPASGGSGTVNVTTEDGCSWTARSNTSWITITSGSSGASNGAVRYSVAENKSKNNRSGTATVAGRTVTISQARAPK